MLDTVHLMLRKLIPSPRILYYSDHGSDLQCFRLRYYNAAEREERILGMGNSESGRQIHLQFGRVQERRQSGRGNFCNQSRTRGATIGSNAFPR